MERMTDVSAQLARLSPSPDDVLGQASTFSPRRWKTGWPHHLGHVPPYRDDAFASLTRAEVFQFADDVHSSGRHRDALIDFIGAAFAFAAGKSPQTQLKLQQFLRNKGQANSLLQALRSLGGLTPVEQYERVRATGLPPRFASVLVYFLAGPQDGSPAPVILSEPAAAALGVDGDSWDAVEYAAYLDAVSAARDEWDASAPLDAVEYALSS
ncbi:hypothetical protein SAMN04488535_1031 [Corynebacterium mycetoides]|uniref:Uncharacterized protein n=2 Tax=Corynebacterium mycetoides TaxID=38302 RepID=A0A1G9NJA3_9CORY|nr:hypothetical protein SAMN04488535_1031 [Corynebacterium mycetoides]